MGGQDEAGAMEELRGLIRDVPDFPKPGILFKDITPLLADPSGFSRAVELLGELVAGQGADALVGIESRGFLFASALAVRMHLPMHLVRKAGKLPYRTAGLDYGLEYGTDRVEIHVDAVEPGQRFAVIDDLIATGGTAAATCSLIEGQGGVISCCAFLIELEFLGGRERLGERPVRSLLRY